MLDYSTVMGTMHVYGFAHQDLRAARKVIESSLSICMEEAEDSDHPGYYFRWYATSGRSVCADPQQLRRIPKVGR